jgi:hypothetical protein
MAGALLPEHFGNLFAETEKHCRDWREFCCPKNLALLNSIGARIRHHSLEGVWFEPSESSEQNQIAAIQRMVDANGPGNFLFRRYRLFDRNSHLQVSLAYFVRGADVDFTLHFACSHHMLFAANSFELTHRIFHGRRRAELFCTDFQLDEKQSCAKKDFPMNWTRETMFPVLLEEVSNRGEDYNFTITDEPLLNAAIKVSRRKVIKLPRPVNYEI